MRVGYSIYLPTDISRLRSSSEDDAPWRSTLSCVCCRNIPAAEIRATIVRGAPAFSFGKWMPPGVAEFAWRSLAVLLDSPSTEEFDGQCEHVADSAFGLDDRWCAWIGVQLASQAQHLHIDAAVEDIFVDAGRLQKVFAGERSLRGIEKRNQQRIFALGERDRDSAGITQAPAAPIKLPGAKSAAASFRVSLGCCLPGFPPAQHRSDARQKFSQTEGLGDVVVGAKFQSNHPVDFVATMTGGDDHGDIGVGPDLAEQIKPVLLGERQIEDHQARFVAGKQGRYFVSSAGRDGADVVFLKVVHHQMPHGAVVLGHKAYRPAAFGTNPLA